MQNVAVQGIEMNPRLRCLGESEGAQLATVPTKVFRPRMPMPLHFRQQPRQGDQKSLLTDFLMPLSSSSQPARCTSMCEGVGLPNHSKDLARLFFFPDFPTSKPRGAPEFSQAGVLRAILGGFFYK